MAILMLAHAKINWALEVTGVRPDGYHALDMLMQRIDLADELFMEPARWISLTVDGKSIPSGGRNLVVRAANALNEYMGTRRGARIRLKKRIPVRAGLGGGSADCAAALLGLNRMWRLNLPESKLMEIGLRLGADVPYLLRGGFARVRGIGDELTPLDGARSVPLVLVRPGGGLSTPHVFAEYDRMAQARGEIDIEGAYRALACGDLHTYDRLSGNALEAPARKLMPEIGRVMERLRMEGAVAVRMSGSGSAVFGVFRTAAEALRALADLKGCQAHCSVMLSPPDEMTYKKLGIQLTCEPQYQSNKLYHR